MTVARHALPGEARPASADSRRCGFAAAVELLEFCVHLLAASRRRRAGRSPGPLPPLEARPLRAASRASCVLSLALRGARGCRRAPARCGRAARPARRAGLRPPGGPALRAGAPRRRPRVRRGSRRAGSRTRSARARAGRSARSRTLVVEPKPPRNRDRVRLPGQADRQVVGRAQRLEVEFDRGVSQPGVVVREHLQFAVVRGRDQRAPALQQRLEDRAREGRAFRRVGARAEFVEQHERARARPSPGSR